MIFLILAQNIDLGYTLAKIRNRYTPVYPSFAIYTCISGIQGRYILHGHVFAMP